MNKRIFWGIGIFSVAVLMGACSDNYENLGNGEEEIPGIEPREVVFSLKNFEADDRSRTNLEVNESGVTFTWAKDDTLGIFPSQGDQVSFAMDEGAGTANAVFSGGSWELKKSSTYYAYYPFSRKYFDGQSSKNKIWVNYKGQSQDGNNSTATIGKYDFMNAASTSPEEGRLLFEFSHLGALVQLSVTVPEKMTVKKMALATENEEFLIEGYYNLEDEIPVYVAERKSKVLSLAMKNVECEANATVTGYLMVPPTDLTGKTLTVRVYDDRNKLYSYTYPAAGVFRAGKSYRFKVGVTESTENPDDLYDKMELSCNMDAYLKENANLGENLNVAVFADLYNEGEFLMKPFVADKNGNLSYTGGTMYFPEDHDVTLYAVYGKLTNWTENQDMPAVYKHTVNAEQTEANYMDNDLLYAAKKVTSDGKNSEILFSHVCSGVRIGVKAAAGTNVAPEKQVTVTLNNLWMAGNLNMKTGEMTPDSGSQKGAVSLGKINMLDSFGDNETYAKATVIPQKLERGTELFTVKNGNKVFKYTIEKLNGLSLEPGKIHTFEIEIDGDSNISVSTSVEDWEVGETIIIDTDK
ncbi:MULTISPECIES: fimbrillin family protein [Phocaeicola]|uniref:Fimbrillin family protein n=1 Tax=Phocaeicola acetigenes TaxID=3016083 RepID=A0ABT4PKN7_9BACT|nr:fimbrillin family protein [Phocaeicola sp. KGMB11183]MCZ8373544.1 fimbrillin family protein [Phocaeicola sp. KGMB11183]